MSIQWSFDTSGMYNLPVVILAKKYKYILKTVMEPGDGRCLHGCEAGTRSEDTEDDWGYFTKYIFNVTPFSAHHLTNWRISIVYWAPLFYDISEYGLVAVTRI